MIMQRLERIAGLKYMLFAAAAIGLIVLGIALISGIASANRDIRSALINGDYDAAFIKVMRAAEKGDPSAQNSAGNLYLLGLGVERDYKAAVTWYLRAALQDNMAAQVNLGYVYSSGLGVRKDRMRAFGWFSLARRKGNERAGKYMRYVIGSALITPNMIKRANEMFPNIEAVRKRLGKPEKTQNEPPYQPKYNGGFAAASALPCRDTTHNLRNGSRGRAEFLQIV